MELQEAIIKYLNKCDHECEKCPLNNTTENVIASMGDTFCNIFVDLEAELSAIP